MRLHLPSQVGHPVKKVTCHAEEAVEVGRVRELHATTFDTQLQIAPSIHNFHLMILDLTSFLTTVRNYQSGRRLLNLLNLHCHRIHTDTKCNKMLTYRRETALQSAL